jgi:hypothetical protein
MARAALGEAAGAFNRASGYPGLGGGTRHALRAYGHDADTAGNDGPWARPSTLLLCITL